MNNHLFWLLVWAVFGLATWPFVEWFDAHRRMLDGIDPWSNRQLATFRDRAFTAATLAVLVVAFLFAFFR